MINKMTTVPLCHLSFMAHIDHELWTLGHLQTAAQHSSTVAKSKDCISGKIQRSILSVSS